MAERRPRIILLSGPGGVGKSTICDRLVTHPRISYCVSATTRSPRPGEVDGRHYFFLTPETFRHRIGEKQFAEFAEVHGEHYGTLKSELEQVARQGGFPLLDLDIKGAALMRSAGYGGVYIFVFPPSLDALRERLQGRGAGPQESERRLERAREEIEHGRNYDFSVVNRELDTAVREVQNILRRELELNFDE